MTVKKIAFASPWFTVCESETKPEWGLAEGLFFTIQSHDGVVILPITDSGQIVMVRQFRPARNQFSLELPAGFIDEGETPEVSARRELLEETGYGGGVFIPLGIGGLALNRDSARQNMFVAKGVTKLTTKSEEALETLLVNSDDLPEKLLSEEFEQLASMGVMMFANLLGHIKFNWLNKGNDNEYDK